MIDQTLTMLSSFKDHHFEYGKKSLKKTLKGKKHKVRPNPNIKQKLNMLFTQIWGILNNTNLGLDHKQEYTGKILNLNLIENAK